MQIIEETAVDCLRTDGDVHGGDSMHKNIWNYLWEYDDTSILKNSRSFIGDTFIISKFQFTKLLVCDRLKHYGFTEFDAFKTNYTLISRLV